MSKSPNYSIPEPAPIANNNPSIHDLVIEDIKDRKQFGLEKYKVLLQAGNGRKSAVDLYQELLDATVYCRVIIEEQKQTKKERDALLDALISMSRHYWVRDWSDEHNQAGKKALELLHSMGAATKIDEIFYLINGKPPESPTVVKSNLPSENELSRVIIEEQEQAKTERDRLIEALVLMVRQYLDCADGTYSHAHMAAGEIALDTLEALAIVKSRDGVYYRFVDGESNLPMENQSEPNKMQNEPQSKTKMTKEQLAAMLNGRQEGSEMTDEEHEIAKENNLLVVFGYSDDNVEFRGILYDEIYADEGAYFGFELIDGRLTCVSQVPQNQRQNTALQINAAWHVDFPKTSWLITANLTSTPFDIFEGDRLFCRGIVIDKNDIPII